MEFSPELDRDLVSQLRFDGAIPPRAVVGALLSFGKPHRVLSFKGPTTEPSSWRWTCVALIGAAIVVVDLTTDDEFLTWGEELQRAGRGTSDVQARWIPLTAVREIRLDAVRAIHVDPVFSASDIRVEGQWGLCLGGSDESIALHAIGGAKPQDAENAQLFIEELMHAVSAARGSS